MVKESLFDPRNSDDGAATREALMAARNVVARALRATVPDVDVGDIERTLPLSDEVHLTAGGFAALGQRIAEATGVVIPFDEGSCDASLDDLARAVRNVSDGADPDTHRGGEPWVIDIEIRDAGASRTRRAHV